MPKYEKLDHWSIKAQNEGYPARSVYKLMEMDKKFHLFSGFSPRSPCAAADLGAAPGSWSLYLLRNYAGRLALTSVDLSPLSERCGMERFEGFRFIRGDLGSDEVRDAVLERGPFDVVLSDAAPATTGSRSIDTARSLELGETALDYSIRGLKRGGALVFKIFQGDGCTALSARLKGLFETVKTCKPAACRSNSFEIYFVCLGKL